MQRIEVKSVVPDSSAKKILDGLIDSFGVALEPNGVMFIRDISNACEFGTNMSGDEVLSSK